jgi:hypothetical protein
VPLALPLLVLPLELLPADDDADASAPPLVDGGLVDWVVVSLPSSVAPVAHAAMTARPMAPASRKSAHADPSRHAPLDALGFISTSS